MRGCGASDTPRPLTRLLRSHPLPPGEGEGDNEGPIARCGSWIPYLHRTASRCKAHGMAGEGSAVGVIRKLILPGAGGVMIGQS